MTETTEPGFIVRRDLDTVRGPDVAYFSSERLPSPPPRAYPEVAPELAVEILSPSDSASEMADKVADRLRRAWPPLLIAAQVHR
jgi:Uma2 family endonuclease